MYCRHQEVIYFNFTDHMLHFLMGSAFSGGKQVPLGGGMMPGGDGKKVDISASATAKIDFLTPIMAPPTLLRPPGGTKHCSPNFLARLIARKGIGAHSIKFLAPFKNVYQPVDTLRGAPWGA